MKDGYVIKNSSDSKVSEKDLELINKLTRRNFGENEVYTFSVVLCDNDIDRENERFTDEALEKLAELYVGKTGILDHNPTSGNQTARIYACKTEQVEKKFNRLKQPYKRLLAKAYMPKSEKNENIILEIDSGIKKEVSVGCAVESKTCSICGKEKSSEECPHIKGRRYKSDGALKICHVVLNNPTDAYEWSFVAVPAQREAGVIKAFTLGQNGGETSMEDVVKNLEKGQALSLSENETVKLYDLIKNLKEKAQAGDFYKNELKSEVLKLLGIVQPEIGTSLLKGITEKLSVEELQSLKKAFKSKLLNLTPQKPQFAPEENQSGESKYNEFKI